MVMIMMMRTKLMIMMLLLSKCVNLVYAVLDPAKYKHTHIVVSIFVVLELVHPDLLEVPISK